MPEARSHPPFDIAGQRVWVAGHRGLVGSALVRRLEREGIRDLVTATSAELDLRRQADTERFVADTQPDVIFLAAAKVGGIQANRSAQAEFLYDNLMIAANILSAARDRGVRKTVLLGSSCAYPRDAPQPTPEGSLLSGPLEPTNEGYAIAKIAALELGKMFRRQYGMDVISLMPSNLYGPGDDYDLVNGHVLAALLRKCHEAKASDSRTVEVWGTGTPRREFLFVDDLADAAVFALVNYSGEEHLNVGTGTDLTIRELAELVAETVGWSGRFVFDREMPDGVARKLLDVSRLTSMGWTATVDLPEGLRRTYDAYLRGMNAIAEP